jgi:cysteine desulfurase / selenocysteine lyase
MPASVLTPAPATLDLDRVRAEFPALHQEIYGRPLVYLDNAATTQKPRAVIDRIVRYYERENANVHRGVHRLSQDATDAMEAARATTAAFLGASPGELIFVRGTTEGANLVAAAWGPRHVRAGDEVLVTEADHHSNFVPWQQLCAATGAHLRVAPVDDDGALDLDAFTALLSERTRLVAVGHVSNALGIVNPVAEIVRRSHDAGARVFVDGAQSVPHLPVDVQALGADFFVFSAHKVYGPTGIGGLYVRADTLADMPPYHTGGGMIDVVTAAETTWAAGPHRFEAGTPHVEGALGMAAAFDYLTGLGLDAVFAHEAEVLAYATERLASVPGVRVFARHAERAGVVSFAVEGAHPYDVGTLLDRLGIAVRTGHHCAQPLMARLGLPGTVRASFAVYNTREEADLLADALARVQTMLT